MNITVNGQPQSISDNTNLNEIITGLIKNCSRVIAEHNGTIIKKDQWQVTSVNDGDKIELVSFVGGG